ncbi:lysophospholipase L1-like esterase [Mariniflexile fucanivorans]|uniref:Lysophospholipase L1-like esterase n=2 Tax=Mariniflexile fucanivorans TaxID=264023 RepID=A0A4R1RID0_9FLAO|nr:lysophospholipase L1-like esterase [Mariniflexile fucanivorans]
MVSKSVIKMKNIIKIKFVILLLVTSSCMAQQSTIYMIGDSTMANKKNPETNPEHGWGQVLPEFFNKQIKIDNRAVNGRSSRSFIVEKRWDSIYNTLKKGDYVFIQFGHNDQKINDPKRYANPHTAYRNNLVRFVLETREKGATPILFSSIVRRNFNEEGTLVDTHGEYPLEVRLVANEYQVSFIDLQYQTELLEETYGVENSKKLHLHFESGENPYYKEAKHDDTHLSRLGATEISKLAVSQLKKQVPSLIKFIL